MRQLQFNGAPISIESASAIRSLLCHEIQTKARFFPVVTYNVSMIGLHSPPLFKWLCEHALFVPDGIGISIGLLARYFCWVSRYPGIDLANDLLQHNSGWRVALIGASPKVIDAVYDQFRLSYSQHEVCFHRHGYASFTSDDYAQLAAALPDLILVAMGCPQQDIMIHQMASVLPSGVAIGVGGAFDVWSGYKQRAPIYLRRLGFEWAYRLVLEPSRIPRLVRAFIRLFGGHSRNF